MKDIKLRTKVGIALVLTALLSLIYYLTYSYIELYSIKWCKTHICIELPSYEDILAIWVAIVGLYFVVTSLEEWKGQYKFERAQQTFKKVREVCYGLEKLLGDTWVLINESRRLGCSHAYENYEEKLESGDLGVKIYLLRSDIFDERNNYRQDDFEKIIDLISTLEYELTNGLRSLHWNDCSQPIKRTEDAEQIFNKYREQLKLVKKNLDSLRKQLYF